VPETNTSENDRVFRKDILDENLVAKIKTKMK
jgi:hypothetical protein